MIHLTEKAAKMIEQISNGDGVGHYIVRVKILGGGCAGFVNDLFFDDQISETDEVAELDGVKVIVDPFSFQYLDETVIDYVENDIGSGFKFINPNAKTSCGCGKSTGY
jgi:iron-sulfur cluster insertion protein